MSEPKIIQTRTGMSVQIMPRQAEIPPADPKAIQLQHIAYYDRPYTSYEGKEITEEVIAKVLEQIPKGLNIYLSLIPYGEDDWLEVNSDGTWRVRSAPMAARRTTTPGTPNMPVWRNGLPW